MKCSICNSILNEKEQQNVNCAYCGQKFFSIDPNYDVNIKINWAEIRILTMWAERWANKIDKDYPGSSLVIACIAKRIKNQYPDKTSLTLAEEIDDLKKEMPSLKSNIPTKSNKIAGEFNI